MRYIRLSAVLLLAACGDGGTTPTSPPTPPTPPAPVATSITLSATTLSFDSLSQVQQLTATVKDQNGATMSGASVSWATSDAAIVTVSSTGQITSVLNGSATVTATSGSANATAAVTVSATYLVVTVTGDGDPLPDVAVWLTNLTGTHTKKTTDAVGTVLYPNLDVGEHTVTLQQVPAGLALTPTSPQTIQVAEDQGHDLVFTGAFPPAQITGTVKAWGKPVEGAVVRVEGKDTVEVTVNSTGVFQVDSVLRGENTLTISNHTGFRFKETTLTQTLASGTNTAEFVGKPEIEPTWASVSTSWAHTCGMTTAGEAYCWGNNNNGRLGFGEGTDVDYTLPMLVSGGHTWASVVAGPGHTCGVTEGVSYCWGRQGNLNDGTQDRYVPTIVSGGLPWSFINPGELHTCGVTTGGEAYCWGGNNKGQLGDGTNGNQNAPTLVSGGLTWTLVSAGGDFTCGVTTGGEAYCWGSNNKGQLGDGTNGNHKVPTLVSSGLTWTLVTPSDWSDHTCGVTTAGEAYCWGNNDNGQLGVGLYGGLHNIPTPVSGGATWASVSAGRDHTCGVTKFKEAYCWGDNSAGELGDRTTTKSSTPVLVKDGFTWTSVQAGNNHTCGVTTGGEAYCWGSNSSGQLGNGTTTNNSVPVKVGGNW